MFSSDQSLRAFGPEVKRSAYFRTKCAQHSCGEGEEIKEAEHALYLCVSVVNPLLLYIFLFFIAVPNVQGANVFSCFSPRFLIYDKPCAYNQRPGIG